MKNRIVKVEKSLEKIERNITTFQENLNRIEHLLTQLLRKEAANRNSETLQYLHQHQISGELVLFIKKQGI